MSRCRYNRLLIHEIQLPTILLVADHEEDDEYSMSAHSMVHQRRRSGRRSALHRRRSSSPFSPCEESGKDRRRSNRQSIATISSVESVSTNSSTSILAPQLIAMSNHTIYLTNHIPTNTLKWSVRIGDIHLSVKRWWTDVYIYIFFFKLGWWCEEQQ